MRLICPNCSTEYAVPEDIIPETGRDVQCEECLHVWRQAPLPVIKRPPLDPYVAAVLRAEATREAAVRAGGRYEEDSDATAALAGTAADHTDEAVTEQPKPDFRPAAEVLAQIEAHSDQTSKYSAEPHDQDPKSLRKTPHDAPVDQADEKTIAIIQLQKERRAFTAGFSFIVGLALIMGLAYANAPFISARIPSLAPGLTVAVNRIDTARARLDQIALRIMGRAES